MYKNLVWSLFLVSAFFVKNTFAQAFQVNPNQDDLNALTASERNSVNKLITDVEDEVNSKLPEGSANQYTGNVANMIAASMSTLGTSYGAPFKVALVGVKASASVDVGRSSLGSLLKGKIDAENLGGIGAAATAHLGINLGLFSNSKASSLFSLKRSKLYLGFGTLRTKVDKVGISFTNFSLIFQHALIPRVRVPLGLFSWNGLQFRTGFRHQNLDLQYKDNVNYSDSDGTVTLDYDTAVRFDLDSSITQIPFELSTSVKMLYFLKVLGGFGMDLNFGGVKPDEDLGTGSVDFSGATVRVDPSLDLGKKKSPLAVNTRIFVGTYLDFYVGHVSLLVKKTLFTQGWGLDLGVSMFL